MANPTTEELSSLVLSKLHQQKPVRLKLQQGGRLLLEQQVPFLCVYTEPAHGVSVLRRWITGEVASMILPSDEELGMSYQPLLYNIVDTLSKKFGTFLLLELKLAEPNPSTEEPTAYNDVAEQVRDVLQPLQKAPPPTFRLYSKESMLEAPIFQQLAKRLQSISLMNQPAQLEKVACQSWSLMGCNTHSLRELPCLYATIEIDHPYVWGAYEIAQWRELRPFLRKVMRSVKRTFFDFSRKHTPLQAPHYLALGRRAIVKAVREIDSKLAEVNRRFEFLLYVTPVNAAAAKSSFLRKKCTQEPHFLYRPLGFEPHLLKRELYQIPIERVDDPTLMHLFLEKQEQLDRQITMLWDRNTPRFLYEGLQLYGQVPDELLQQAKELLRTISPRARGESSKALISPETFVQRAQQEIAAYQKLWPAFSAEVHLRSDVTGILVSQGNLLVGEDAVIPEARIEPLLHHEVGTHCLTTANGSHQPLSLLGHGLAGYEGLQEGLAVLSEYLCGGLRKPRLRLLASRVVAAHSVTQGASFLDTFRLLHHEYGCSRSLAFTITMRVHRGGGFVKDMVYLKGLRQLLHLLQQGQPLEPLYVGKIGNNHAPLVQELLWRKVLDSPKLLPFFLQSEVAQQRLQEIRNGHSLTDIAARL